MQFAQNIKMLKNCIRYFDNNCNSKEIEPLRKITEPIPETDFMKEMKKLTGLTGAALILYIIISEGSQLFPLRNLITNTLEIKK